MNRPAISFFLLLVTPGFFVPDACATSPFPTKRVTCESKTISAELKPISEGALTLLDEEGKVIATFDLDKLKLAPPDLVLGIERSTAGIGWYLNSIAFFDKKEAHLVVRFRSGQLLVIDVKSKSIVSDIPEELKKEIDKALRKQAQELLESDTPSERQTGAIVCGQMSLRDAIPKLRDLLDDDSHMLRGADGPDGHMKWTKMYYVRKAAKEALEAMGEKVEGIILETPESALGVD